MYIFDLGDSFFEILVNKWHHVEIVWCILENLKVWAEFFMDWIFMTCYQKFKEAIYFILEESNKHLWKYLYI